MTKGESGFPGKILRLMTKERVVSGEDSLLDDKGEVRFRGRFFA
jgi:hypothetical protein